MQPVYQDAQATLYLGDSRAVLPTLPDHSVDAIVTDPPAGIAFMNKTWDRPGVLGVSGGRAMPVTTTSRNPSCQNCGGRKRAGPATKSCQCSEPTWNDYDYRQRDRAAFIAFLTEIFQECRRVLKPGGHALVWGLPRTSHWTATALEDAGFEIRDCITHLFGQGFPKSLNLHGEHDGWGTALKPGAEFWWLARAPLSEPTVAANVARWGTGALNIDGCRITIQDTHNGFRAGTYAARNDSRTSWEVKSNGAAYVKTPHAAGRWPANVVLSHTLWCAPLGTRQVRGSHDTTGVWGKRKTAVYDGGWAERDASAPDAGYTGRDGLETVEAWACDAACPVRLLDEQSGVSRSTDRPRHNSHGVLKYGGQNARPSHNTGADEIPGGYADTGGASRFFKVFGPDEATRMRYQPKPSRAERDMGLPNGERSAHPTVKSIALMDWLIRLITPPGGVVLDPFMGSGSTGIAAVRGGWQFIGVELDSTYCDLARQRLGVPA